MGYLDGSIKCRTRARNTNLLGKASEASAKYNPSNTYQDPLEFYVTIPSPSLEEWTNCDARTMGLLLFNIKDAVGRGINIDDQDLRNTLYIKHTDFNLFIAMLRKMSMP